MNSPLVYPIYSQPRSVFEKIALITRVSPGYCPVCGRFTIMTNWFDNFRDSGWCLSCKASNRQRQIAHLISNRMEQRDLLPTGKFSKQKSLSKLHHHPFDIYNTETSGALHAHLADFSSYSCSEFMGDNYSPGQKVKGIRNENLMNLSFDDLSFDLVISSDVLEHVPFPYQAHEEIWRVLKSGGIHIFTVPFHQTEYKDDIRAELHDGEVKYLKEPIYHSDPLREDSILVYTIFSLGMLLKLQEIGFQTHIYRFYSPFLGILGPNGIVFEAIKI